MDSLSQRVFFPRRFGRLCFPGIAMEGADDVCGALAKVSFAEILRCSAGYSHWPKILLSVVIKKNYLQCTQTECSAAAEFKIKP